MEDVAFVLRGEDEHDGMLNVVVGGIADTYFHCLISSRVSVAGSVSIHLLLSDLNQLG